MTLVDALLNKLKSKYDTLGREDYKKNFLNALPFWLGAFITGLIAVLYAKIFAWAEVAALFIFGYNKWLFLLLTPGCFVLAWWLVSRFAPLARGSGIPQVSAAIELSTPKHYHKIDRLLSLRIIFFKVLSSVIMVFGGGLVGREGPTIQVSASIFKKINDWLPKWFPNISRRNMIVTGGAAGLASAFNTPLGGIVFAIEELTKTHFNYFKSALLTGVIIAGLTALNLLGPYLYLGYPKLDAVAPWIFFAVIFVALVTGMLGSAMGAIIMFIINRVGIFKEDYRKLVYVAVCGLLIAMMAVFIDNRVLASGKGIMVTTLFTDSKYVPWYIPLVRIVGTVLSFSVGAAGGIFAPALSMGASVGSAFSGLLNLSGSETNLIILCGMTGALTGVTRSPFTSSIVVIEMTNSHSIIFDLMLAALLANLIAATVSRQSFYDRLKEFYIEEILSEEGQTVPQAGTILTPPLPE